MQGVREHKLVAVKSTSVYRYLQAIIDDTTNKTEYYPSSTKSR